MRRWKGRYINPLIWEDEWFMGMTASEQHLWNYLLTNPRTVETNIGVYQLNLQTAAFHTKIDYQEIKRIFKDRYTPDGRAFFEVGWVILPKWLKHQSTNNNNMWTGAANEFQQLPQWLNEKVLDPDSPMYMDVRAMSDGILSLYNELNADGSVKNPSLPFGLVVNDSLKESKLKESKLNSNETKAAPAAGENREGSKNLEEERKKLYGRKGMR